MVWPPDLHIHRTLSTWRLLRNRQKPWAVMSCNRVIVSPIKRRYTQQTILPFNCCFNKYLRCYTLWYVKRLWLTAKPDAPSVLAVAGNLLQLLDETLLPSHRYREDHIQRHQLTVIMQRAHRRASYTKGQCFWLVVGKRFFRISTVTPTVLTSRFLGFI